MLISVLKIGRLYAPVSDSRKSRPIAVFATLRLIVNTLLSLGFITSASVMRSTIFFALHTSSGDGGTGIITISLARIAERAISDASGGPSMNVQRYGCANEGMSR